MEVIGKLHAAAALLPGGKSSVPLEHHAGFQSRLRCFGKEKYLLPSLGIEKRFLTHTARTGISVPTTIPAKLLCWGTLQKPQLKTFCNCGKENKVASQKYRPN
jgi:hypothetical protein